MCKTSPWRADFPALTQFDQQNLTYLDNAATTQKPQIMLDALLSFYQQGVANTHRAGHQLAVIHTQILEQAREQIASWFGMQAHNLIFTKNATESCNLLAWSLAHNFKAEDEIAVSALEHHSNFLVWQQLAKRHQLKLVILPVNKNGVIDLNQAQNLISAKCRLVAVSELSNIFGTYQPITDLAYLAHKVGALFVVDGAQAVATKQPNLAQLPIDFYCCSAHKIYGPDGLGLLLGKDEALTNLKTWQLGGGMVLQADFNSADFLTAPHSLEAGTQALSSIYAFAATLEYLQQQNSAQIKTHLQKLHQQLITGLKNYPKVQIFGKPQASLVSFNVHNFHNADVAHLLSEQGVLVRAGKHCVMPLFSTLNLAGVVRVSLGIYNDEHDLQLFFNALSQTIKLLEN